MVVVEIKEWIADNKTVNQHENCNNATIQYFCLSEVSMSIVGRTPDSF